MRKVAHIFLSVVFAALCSCSGGGSVGTMDILTNENTEADLGIIKEKNGPVQARLLVPNESADTLVPLATATRCSCISASVEKKPVPPGENLVIEIVYNPAYRKGIFMEEIGVQILGRSPLSLIVKGDIVPAKHPVEEDHPYYYGEGLHLSHEVLHYGRLKAGETKDIFIRCANGRRRSAQIEFRAEGDCGDAIRFRSGLALEGGGRDTLHFRLTMPEGAVPGDTLRIPLQPYVNGKPTGKTMTAIAVPYDNRSCDN